jgi:hypothetical protein
MLSTGVPTYTVRMDGTVWLIEPLTYDNSMDEEQIRAAVRTQLGYA